MRKKKEEYKDIDLVKTDYDNFKNLSFFINQYKKAQEMIKEVGEFYQSFLLSKLVPMKDLLRNDKVNFLYVIEDFSEKYTFDNGICYEKTRREKIIGIINVVYDSFYWPYHYAEKNSEIDKFYDKADQLKKNAEKYVNEKYNVKNLTNKKLVKEMINDVNSKFSDEINELLTFCVKYGKHNDYFYFLDNNNVPHFFAKTEKELKKCSFELNEKEKQLDISNQIISSKKKYVWPSDAPIIKTTRIITVSFDIDTNDYKSSQDSSGFEEIKDNYY